MKYYDRKLDGTIEYNRICDDMLEGEAHFMSTLTDPKAAAAVSVILIHNLIT